MSASSGGVAVFFVTSDGDSPTKLYFNLGDAIAEDPEYIDIFDAYGNYISAMEAGNVQNDGSLSN